MAVADPSIDFDRELAWTKRHMPYLERALDALPDLGGMRLACSIHLDIKMAPWVEGLLERGASVYLTTCNPNTVRDSVVQHLGERGAVTNAWNGMSEDAYRAAIEAALAWGPTHLCEMGAELSVALHQGRAGPNPAAAASAQAAAAEPIRSGLEATGSGIERLRELPLEYPVFNWDDLPVKEGLHNRRMVGLTAWHAFFERTGLTLHGMHVVVVGYGSVGRGVAESARAYGGGVTVCERDGARRLEAEFAGWHTRRLRDALPEADVVITATGARNVIGEAEIALLKHGAFLLNVGHLWHEIDVETLRAYPHEELLPQVEVFHVEDRELYLFAGSSMANLTAGRGDSLNAFDVTLAVLTGGVGYMWSRGDAFESGVHTLPREAWISALE
jgi:adenosylhomocysteinase